MQFKTYSSVHDTTWLKHTIYAALLHDCMADNTRLSIWPATMVACNPGLKLLWPVLRYAALIDPQLVKSYHQCKYTPCSWHQERKASSDSRELGPHIHARPGIIY